MTRVLFSLLILSIPCITLAQSSFHGWLAVNNMFKVNSKFSLHLDLQARTTNDFEHLNTFIFRPAVNWHFRKNMIATAGYGFISHRRTVGDVSGYSPEHRIWEQLIINHNLEFVAMQHRFRLEQRFIGNFRLQGNEIKNEGNRYANRIRYFNRSVIPFNGSKPFKRGIFGVVQDEVFLNIGNNSAVNGKSFDQNRLYLALGYRFSPKFDIDAGYMNQYVAGANKTFNNGHILQLATYLRL